MVSRPMQAKAKKPVRKVTNIDIYRKNRRKAGQFRWALMVVFALACLFAGYFFAISPFFSVREIRIAGNNQVDSQRIIQLSGIESGDNIFAVNNRSVKQLLQIEPRIKDAEVSRSLTGKITITVEERQSVATAVLDQVFVTIDDQGRILARSRAADGCQLPLITGLPQELAATAAPGCYIRSAEMEQALSIVADLQNYVLDLGEVNVADAQQIKLYTLTGVEVRMGDRNDLPEKYLMASAIINDHSETGTLSRIRYIDVSAGQAVVSYKQ
ncbi:MAG: FtsQ-type POTRA domain-containing protein [Firmicutes bacterium]|nr:FtsQ-type POTRA domain-containing protein [Bacillota bacterium]